jgi:polyhydroxyalkanoate synthesis regulator phasin
MSWLDGIKERLKKVGVEITGKSDSDIKKIAEDLGLKEDAPAPTPAPAPTQTQTNDVSQLVATVAGIQETVTSLATSVKTVVDTVQVLKTDRDNADTASKAQKVQSAIDDAVKKGRIENNPDRIAKWKTRLEKDFDLANESLQEIPENPSLAKTNVSSNSSSNNTSASADQQQQTVQTGQPLTRAALLEQAKEAFKEAQ